MGKYRLKLKKVKAEIYYEIGPQFDIAMIGVSASGDFPAPLQAPGLDPW